MARRVKQETRSNPSGDHMKLPLMARAAILLALMDGGELTPVDLRARLKECELHVSNGSLYPALKSLVADGLVVAVSGNAFTASGTEADASYSLTRQGRKTATGERNKLLRLMLGPPERQKDALQRLQGTAA